MISKIKPEIEFVAKTEKPGKIGVKRVGVVGTAWYTRKFLQKYIANIEIDSAFWREVLDQLPPNPQNPTEKDYGKANFKVIRIV